jgi:hypothetical protein
MPSKWIEHVKAHAKEKGMKYKDALKCAECKASYKVGSGRPTLPDNTKFHFGIAQVPVEQPIEQPIEQPVVEGSGMKRTSPWIEHVRTYAKANGIKYSDALKDPACKASYKTGSGLTQSSKAVAPEPVHPEPNFPLTGRPLQRRNRGGRRINRVSAEPIDIPVAVQSQAEEIRGAIPVATRVHSVRY